MMDSKESQESEGLNANPHHFFVSSVKPRARTNNHLLYEEEKPEKFNADASDLVG